MLINRISPFRSIEKYSRTSSSERPAESKSVLLSELATCIPDNATNYLQIPTSARLFCEAPLDFNAVAALTVTQYCTSKLGNMIKSTRISKNYDTSHHICFTLPSSECDKLLLRCSLFEINAASLFPGFFWRGQKCIGAI